MTGCIVVLIALIGLCGVGLLVLLGLMLVGLFQKRA